MIECLRDEWLYSEKPTRDVLFTIIRQITDERAPLMVSQLSREAASLARERSARAGRTVDNIDAVTRAVVKTLVMSGALRTPEDRAIPFDVATQAALVGRLTDDFADRAEAFLLEFVIDRLGDVTPGDHRALAHALFRQFDARISIDELEDRVAMLLASLRDRISLSGEAYEVVSP